VGNSNPGDPTNAMVENYVEMPDTINEEIAELIGAHIGDGNSHVRKSDYRLSIAGNAAKDQEYMSFLANLFYKNFKIIPKIYVRKNNSIYLIVRSKKLHKFYIAQLKLPIGPKANITIPKFIVSKKNFLVACIRGIFDTDGSVVIQKFGKYQYTSISISTTSKRLAKGLAANLKQLGFKPYICKRKPTLRSPLEEYSVRVKGWEQVRKWKELIGSHNPRNSIKLNQIAHGQS